MATLFYWTGAAVWGLAALYGLSEAGLWIADKAIKRLGLWPTLFAAAVRVRQEREGWKPGG